MSELLPKNMKPNSLKPSILFSCVLLSRQESNHTRGELRVLF